MSKKPSWSRRAFFYFIHLTNHLNQGEKIMSQTTSANCPECDALIEVQDVMEAEIVVCPDCGVDLEVTGTNPLKLQPAPMEKEDWGE
jgi:alpha-aminoadipate/glutamate carrier protein LysW